MRYWLIAIKNSIPPRWLIVLAPFGALVASFLIWLAISFYFKPSQEQLKHLAEIESLRTQVSKGNPNAQYRTGIILRDGLSGGEKQTREAAKMFQLAAKKGHFEAQFALGKLHFEGDGVRKDYRVAARLYKSAAQMGSHRDAQFELGRLYYKGRGVGHDYSAAVDWFRRAAMQNHPGAQFVMASMYEKGWGVEKNLAEAFALYALAAEYPSRVRSHQEKADPIGEVKRLKKDLSRLDLKRGRERLRILKDKLRR